MFSVHFKLKSAALDAPYSTIQFDSPSIGLADLKARIAKSQKNTSNDFDFKIKNESTGEDYSDQPDSFAVPSNSQLQVTRVPMSGRPPAWHKLNVQNITTTQTQLTTPVISGTSESDKMKLLMTADPSQIPTPGPIKKSWKLTGPVPPDYSCHRCHQPGHWISDCPTNGNKDYDVIQIKNATGIPRQCLEITDQKDGSVVMDGGVTAQIVMRDFRLEKKKKLLQETGGDEEPKEMKDEFLCELCKKKLQEPVTMPCCKKVVCKACVNPKKMPLPTCGLCNVSFRPNQAKPNTEVAAAMARALNKQEPKEDAYLDDLEKVNSNGTDAPNSNALPAPEKGTTNLHDTNSKRKREDDGSGPTTKKPHPNANKS